MNNFFFKSIYIFSVIVIASCNNINGSKQLEAEARSIDCIDVEKYYNEFLDIDSMTINNSIRPIASKFEVEKVFGKPIKIEFLDKPTALTLFLDEKQSNLKRLYFKNAIFESNQDKLVLSSINFNNNSNTITHPSIVLNNNTVGLDLDKKFHEHLKSKVLYKRGCNICSFSVNIKIGKNNDDFWSLVFLTDTLSRLEFHPISFDE